MTLTEVGIHPIECDPGHIRVVGLNRFCSIQQRHIGDYSIGRWKHRKNRVTVTYLAGYEHTRLNLKFVLHCRLGIFSVGVLLPEGK